MVDDTHELYASALAFLKLGECEKAIGFFKQISPEYELFKSATFQPAQCIPESPYVASLKNICIDTERWIIFDDKNYYITDTSGREVCSSPLVSLRCESKGRHIVIHKKNVSHIIDKPVLFLGGDYNYCHWLLRYLMRLSLIENIEHLKDLPLLVTSELKSFHLEILDLMGIDRKRLLKVPPNELIFCSELIVPINLRSPSRAREGLFGQGCHWLRKELMKDVLGKGTPLKRLYVSREDVPQTRKFVNEEEIWKFLETLGFEKVVPGQLTVSEQIKQFSQAQIIVGPHGAGLTNILFSPKGCVVIELSNVLLLRMADFAYISYALSLNYKRLTSVKVQLYPGKSEHDFHDFWVDKSQLEQLFKYI